MNRSADFEMQVIGSFLSYASRGDKVGLNQMLLKGTSPDVQDYDRRTALHLAASEGHASIVELLLHYNANVNLQDRWQRTPLTDARLYGHRDICRILEVNGGKDSLDDDNSLTFTHEQSSVEVSIDLSELILKQSSTIEQGNLDQILTSKSRLDLPSSVRYALDIARNLLLDEGGHLKIGEYWVHMLYQRIHPNQEICQRNGTSADDYNQILDTKKDILSFAHIFYMMLEGRLLNLDVNFEITDHLNADGFEPKFRFSRAPARIQQLIKECCDKDPCKRPPFRAIIDILDEVSTHIAKYRCPVC
ncbi:hypothetical protein Sjap_015124 [Stephania japonica]|uniref:Uncharacterized protein n=1 Tax=Stephania japonica TaxID=461633 RepID=A0AAP0IKF3_9MAGN